MRLRTVFSFVFCLFLMETLDRIFVCVCAENNDPVEKKVITNASEKVNIEKKIDAGIR